MDTTRRRPKIGLVAGGLGAYWPQFPDLLPALERSAAYVSERISGYDAETRDGRYSLITAEGTVVDGHRSAGLRAVAGLLDLPLVEV